MEEVLRIAQETRERLLKLYKERREDVTQKNLATRQDIDAHFVRLMKSIKAFAADFLATLTEAVQEWEATLADRSREIDKSLNQIRGEQHSIELGIEKEARERKEAIDSATAAVKKKLGKIREDLGVTARERRENELAYDREFIEHFKRMHLVLDRVGLD